MSQAAYIFRPYSAVMDIQLYSVLYFLDTGRKGVGNTERLAQTSILSILFLQYRTYIYCISTRTQILVPKRKARKGIYIQS